MAAPSRAPAPSQSLGLLLPAFCALVLLLVAGTAAAGRLPGAGRVAGVWAGLGLAGLLLERLARRFDPDRALALRVVAALGLLVAVYSALGLVLPWLLPEDREWQLLAFDRRFLGYTWEGLWGPVAAPLLTDVLAVVYASFYLCPLVLLAALARRHDREGVAGGLDRILLGFLLSYCGYLLVPARSPWLVEAYAGPLPSLGLQPWIHGRLLAHSPTVRDCFPSGHAMLTAYVAWLAWGRLRPLFPLFLAWALLTAAATVYLRYHYLVDVLCGLLACLAWILLSERVLGPWRLPEGRPRPARGP